jgi:hypothetical protein
MITIVQPNEDAQGSGNAVTSALDDLAREGARRIKLRTRVTKGAGSRAAGLTMAFKLLQAAQGTWCRLDAHDLLPLVRAGVLFQDGQQTERPEQRSDKKGGKVAA